MSDLEDLKSRVREAFRIGPPNGWVLGWDASRLFREISAVVSPLQLFNETSFDYSFCNRFVASHATSAGTSYDLTVRISFVARYYSVHWTRRGPQDTAEVVTIVSTELRAIEQKVKRFLESRAFSEFPSEWIREPMTDIDLELAGRTKSTLEKCVFEDFEGA